MAKDEEHPPSNRLRQFRKLFNDYTKERKSLGRRPSNSSNSTDSPASTPQKRSAGRIPRSRKRDEAAKNKTSEPRDASPSSPSTGTPEKGTPEKEAVVEAKDLAHADDEEFENVGSTADNLAKCTIKTRDLQWKGGFETDKNKKLPTEVTVADKNAYKSMNDEGDKGVAVRRKKSTLTPEKKRSRRKKTGSNSSPFNPSAETLDDSLPVEKVEKGVRGRGRRSSGRSRSPLSAETCNESAADGMQDIDQNSVSFKQAIKLMEVLKRNNLLENALFPAQNEVVKAFFEGGMRNPDNKILGLINKAMDFVLDAVFFRGEDLDCMLDNDLKLFIVDRSKSKPILLDVIISRPEFLPQSWGGRTVVLRQQNGEVNVHPEHKKEDKR